MVIILKATHFIFMFEIGNRVLRFEGGETRKYDKEAYEKSRRESAVDDSDYLDPSTRWTCVQKINFLRNSIF